MKSDQMLRKCGKYILPDGFPLVTMRIYQIMLLLLSISRVYFSKTIRGPATNGVKSAVRVICRSLMFARPLPALPSFSFYGYNGLA